MAKDYKNTAKPGTKPAKKPIPVWLTFGVGLLTGLFVALIFYLQDRKESRVPAVVQGPVIEAPAPRQAPAAEVKEKNREKAKVEEKAPAKKNADAADKDDTIAGIPKFDFYTILPNLEVILPDQEVTDKRESHNAQEPAREATAYLLQVGSFRLYSEADRLKARLALLGVESSIQKVIMANDETWHRVRVGPMSSYRKIDSLRRRLNSNNISSIILKVKTDG